MAVFGLFGYVKAPNIKKCYSGCQKPESRFVMIPLPACLSSAGAGRTDNQFFFGGQFVFGCLSTDFLLLFSSRTHLWAMDPPCFLLPRLQFVQPLCELSDHFLSHTALSSCSSAGARVSASFVPAPLHLPHRGGLETQPGPRAAQRPITNLLLLPACLAPLALSPCLAVFFPKLAVHDRSSHLPFFKSPAQIPSFPADPAPLSLLILPCAPLPLPQQHLHHLPV